MPAATPRRLVAELQARDKFSSVVSGISEKLEHMTHATMGADMAAMKFGAGGAAMGAVGVGAGLAIVGLAKSYGELEHQLNKTRAIMGRVTNQDMEAMRKKVLQIGRDTTLTATEVGTSLTVLAQQGFNSKQATAMLDAVSQLAIALDAGVTPAAELLTSAMKQYGIQTSQSTKLSDAMVGVANAAATNFADLSEGFVYAGSTARQLGVSYEDLLVLMGMLNDAGVKGSMAGTTLREAFKDLISPTREATGVLARYGITSDRAAKLIKNPREMLQALAPMLGNSADIFAVFGSRSNLIMTAVQQEMDSLSQRGVSRFNELSAAVKDAQKAHEGLTMAQQMMKDTQGALQNLAASVDILKQNIFKAGLAKEFQGWVQSGTKLVNHLAELSPQTLKFAGSALMAATAVGLVGGGALLGFAGLLKFLTLVALLPTNMTILIEAVQALPGAFLALKTTLVSLPLARVGVGLRAVGRELVTLWVINKKFGMGGSPVLLWFRLLPLRLGIATQSLRRFAAGWPVLKANILSTLQASWAFIASPIGIALLATAAFLAAVIWKWRELRKAQDDARKAEERYRAMKEKAKNAGYVTRDEVAKEEKRLGRKMTGAELAEFYRSNKQGTAESRRAAYGYGGKEPVEGADAQQQLLALQNQLAQSNLNGLGAGGMTQMGTGALGTGQQNNYYFQIKASDPAAAQQEMNNFFEQRLAGSYN